MRLAHKHDITLEWKSDVVSDPSNTCALDDLNVTLRPYQVDAVNTLIEKVQGYVVLPCGGGKTTLGASAAIMLGEATIICVHTEDLAYQWAETIEHLCYEKPRIVGCGTPNDMTALQHGEIAVCLIQTLSKSIEKSLPLIQSAGTIIIDECHHVAANSFQRIISRCTARFRWGLTATPSRPDNLDFLLDLHIGPRLFQMSTSELVDLGFLMRPDVQPIYTQWSPAEKDYDKDGRLIYARAVTKACKDGSRSQLIIDLARMAYQEDRTTMILVPRVGYATALAKRLQQEGISATAVTGKSNKQARKHRLNDVRNGRSSVIVATQLADEGLDVPNLDCLILATAGRAQGRAIQRAGRIMRISENKQKPIIFDLIDGGPFKSQWKSRVRAYKEHLNVEPLSPMNPSDDLTKVFQPPKEFLF
jgi:superfamily II DNA or RNA helicase